jgi:hypothetical protein
MPLFSTYITLLLDKLFVGFVKSAENYTNQCAVKDGLVVKLDTAALSRVLGTFYNVIKEIKKYMSITTRLILILAGALFYATVKFSFFLFFCSVQKYSILSTAYSIILAKCTLVRKKGVFPPLKTKAKPDCIPPFLLPLTPPLCMAVCEQCSG